MGYGYSKNLVIKELNQLIDQIKQENLDLESERDNLKLQQELKSNTDSLTKDSIEALNDLLNSLESQLIEAKHLSVAFLPSNILDHELHARIKEVVSIQNEIEEKDKILNDLKKQIRNLNKERQTHEVKTVKFQCKIQELELSILGNDKLIDNQQNYYREKIMELTENKSKILRNIQDYENICKELSDEIISSENSKEDPDEYTYERLLAMSESEILSETKKLENEIEDLTEHLKQLKEKEIELEQMNNYINTLQTSTPSKISQLKTQASESRSRIQYLINEKERLKENLGINRNSFLNTKKLLEPNDIQDHGKETSDYSKRVRPSISEDIEKTLEKARNLTNSIRFKNF
jgi:chromosome segregation ATPase